MDELVMEAGPMEPVAPAIEPLGAPAPVTPTSREAPIGAFRQWYMVIALTVLSMVATVDRSGMSLVLDPIKTDLRLTDTQLAVLIGASYAVFHIVLTFPMGWFVDRFNRKYVLILGGLAWSVCTVSTGLAHSFWQLFAGRAGVGFGDGGLIPASFSLIRDGVARERQGRSFAIYNAGVFIGGALALAVAAGILAVAKAHGPLILPVIGVVKPWQMVFIALGLGGLPFIGLMAGILEPDRTKAGVADSGSYLAALRYMASRWKVYLPLMSFNTIYGIVVASYGFWAPTLVHRNYGLPLSQVGPIMALIILAVPGLGLFTYGSVLDALTKRGVRDGPALVIIGGILITFLPSTLTSLMPSVTLFWISFAVMMFVAGSLWPATQVINTRVTPSMSAGKILVLYMLPQSLFQLMGSSIIVGAMSDRLYSGPHALAYAISTNNAVFLLVSLPFAIWLLFAARRLTPAAERPDSKP